MQDRGREAFRDQRRLREHRGVFKEILEYEGKGLSGGLQPGTSWSEKIAEDSLQVDDVTHGDVDKAIPDIEGRKRLSLHVPVCLYTLPRLAGDENR
jgi:hypothetical protein